MRIRETLRAPQALTGRGGDTLDGGSRRRRAATDTNPQEPCRHLEFSEADGEPSLGPAARARVDDRIYLYPHLC